MDLYYLANLTSTIPSLSAIALVFCVLVYFKAHGRIERNSS